MDILGTETVLYERELYVDSMYYLFNGQTTNAVTRERTREHFVRRVVIDLTISREHPEAVIEIRHHLDRYGCRYSLKTSFDHNYYAYAPYTPYEHPLQDRIHPSHACRVEIDIDYGRIPVELLRKHKSAINYIHIETKTLGRQEELAGQLRPYGSHLREMVHKSFIVYPHRKGEDISFLYTDNEAKRRLYQSIFGFETNKESVKELKLERFED